MAATEETEPQAATRHLTANEMDWSIIRSAFAVMKVATKTTAAKNGWRPSELAVSLAHHHQTMLLALAALGEPEATAELAARS